MIAIKVKNQLFGGLKPKGFASYEIDWTIIGESGNIRVFKSPAEVDEAINKIKENFNLEIANFELVKLGIL